jgi:DNA topoisomerase-1
VKLIIVESPAKARTIEKFLGPEYRVAASYGHVRDLPSSAKEIPSEHRRKSWARMGVDIDNGFQPIYVVPAASKKQVTALRALVRQADELLLATDEDREGEAISWHLLEVLRPEIPVKRITFHEITKPAIERALANPRDVNGQVVRAQESRRILDRLYGYTLSPVLWKKIRTKLSAGRVQSVAVRLIVEREEERQAFHAAEYWDVEADLRVHDLTFKARLTTVDGQRLAAGKDFDPATGRLKPGVAALVLDGERTAQIADAAHAAQPWRVQDIQQKETRQRPSPPFTTSTLQQAASSQLGFSPQRTMQIAQRLYEGIDLGDGGREGLITYMRTDSLTLSEKALGDAADWIRSEFGMDYTLGPRRYKTKSKTAQEAHEAIRPTEVRRSPQVVAGFLSREELALYRLIWNRMVASQMTDAVLDRTSIDFRADCQGSPHIFRASGSVVRFSGFWRVYGQPQKETVLPDLGLKQTVGRGGDIEASAILGVAPLRHETSPPARYSEASLVKKLEEEGIGRPSTYAPIISTIQARNYVVKKSGVLLPTYLGMAVVQLMRKHFTRYVDYGFTANMEEDLDRIAAGQIDWVDFLSRFYGDEEQANAGLLGVIAREMPSIEFPAIPLGADPDTGEEVTVRIGRNYVFVQSGAGENGRRATVPVDLLIDELTLAKALELIKARTKAQEPLGQDPHSGQNVYALIGPYGPYLQLGESGAAQKPKRISLDRNVKLDAIGLDYALRMLSLPRQLGNDPQTGQPVAAGRGRFGPYVSRARTYAKLDSEDQIFTITLSEALQRIQDKSRRTILKELGPHPESGAPIQILKGRFGPYVTDGQNNARLARGADVEAVTLTQALALLREAATKSVPGAARAKRTVGSRAKRKTAVRGDRRSDADVPETQAARAKSQGQGVTTAKSKATRSKITKSKTTKSKTTKPKTSRGKRATSASETTKSNNARKKGDDKPDTT